MIKLKNEICQKRLEIVLPGKAEAEHNIMVPVGGPDGLARDWIQGAVVARGWQ